MAPENVNCNQCGAPLEVAAGCNFVTCARCGTPLAVQRTASSIYTVRAETRSDFTTPDLRRSVLPPVEVERSGDTEAELSELHRQNECNRLENQLNRLDFEWERQKEQYMVSGRYGHRYLPAKGSSVAGGLIIAAFGTLWTIFAFGITTGFTWSLSEEVFGPPPIIRVLFPLFGVVFVLIGIGSSIHAYNKAEQYEQAYQAYQRERSRLFNQIEKARRRS